MSLNPSPAIAALLSFFFPGVGQIYAGDLRKGVLWAIPMILFVLAIIWLLIGPKLAIANLIFSPQTRMAILVLNVAFFLYHVAAMVDAYSVAKAERYRGFNRTSATAPVVLAGLVAVTMLLHGVPEVIGLDVDKAANILGVGHPDVLGSFTPRPLQTPSITPVTATPTPGDTAEPSGSLEPTPVPSGSIGPEPTPRACPQTDYAGWAPADDGRLNILLSGSDSRSDEGASTNSIRTDSMMLLSIEIATCKAALFSFPRNMNCDVRYPEWFHIPLERGGDYADCLNYLWRSAAANPGSFDGSEGIGPECQAQFDCERGWRALRVALEFYANQKIDGVIAVNLKGFVALVEALPGHGVWIDVPYKLVDLPGPCPGQPEKTCAYYDSQQNIMRVDFDPGCQFLNGEEALAFARSRHQDDDYQRGRRQQIFLQQVRRQLDPLALLGSLNNLIAAAEQNLFMTFAQADFANLAQIASHVDADRLYRVDFAPARLTELGNMDGMSSKIYNIFSEREPLPNNQGEPPCPPN
jgi:anionic cell wall polymer biosynthesis LytR-Cps2A-Psr (LCP) family protein/TM2 domain-containing membrane protein YozV